MNLRNIFYIFSSFVVINFFYDFSNAFGFALCRKFYSSLLFSRQFSPQRYLNHCSYIVELVVVFRLRGCDDDHLILLLTVCLPYPLLVIFVQGSAL